MAGADGGSSGHEPEDEDQSQDKDGEYPPENAAFDENDRGSEAEQKDGPEPGF